MSGLLLHDLILKWSSLAVCIAYYVAVLFLNEVPQDVGDGLQHFSIAQASWENPTLFLDHWGKPLFTLFSSPFAQFGSHGVGFFNVLVFAFTIIIGFSIFRKHQLGNGYYILFPLVLIAIPDYSSGIIAGMTEPFFGLLLLLLVYGIFNEKWTLFAIIASFIPFARSEGMLVVIVAFSVLLLTKNWKQIPLLATGFVLYAIAGQLLLQQPLWYFENDPYPAESIYGSGDWFEYVKQWKYHFGVITILCLPISLVGWLIWKSKEKRTAWLLAWFVCSIYLGIIIIHSYLWANGLKGALGLSRIATQGLPPFILFLFLSMSFFWREINSTVQRVVALIIFLFCVEEISELPFPNSAMPFQKTLFEACNYVQSHKESSQHIYYFHPLIPYHWNINAFKKNQFVHQRFINLDFDTKNTFKTGDLLIRDSQFGALEQGLKFENLEQYPWIIPVKHFYANELYRELNGEYKSIIVYQVMDKNTFDKAKFLQQYGERSVAIRKPSVKVSFKKGEEFADVYSQFKIPTFPSSQKKLIIKINSQELKKQQLYLIFDDGKGQYISEPITDSVLTLSFVGITTGKLFIHNPEMKAAKLSVKLVDWTYREDCGIIHVNK